MQEQYHPNEDNLGKRCRYWSMGSVAVGCFYSKFELEGRITCQGTIDDICLYIKDGRPLTDETSKLLSIGIKTSIPNSSLLPPGAAS